MKIDIKELSENAVKLIGDHWMLISAGERGAFNTMTANWGGMGYLWNKPVVFVFVRPERYTYQFVENHELFSLSFFAAEYKKTLGVLGTKSGRDMDKMGASGLTPVFTESGTPAFSEARIVLECKKLYSDMILAENFIERDILEKWYGGTKGDFHRMYVAEIVGCEMK